MTRETVVVPTPAAFATSRRVGGLTREPASFTEDLVSCAKSGPGDFGLMYHNQFVLQRLRPSSALKQAFQSSIPLIAATEGTSLATVPFFYALTQKKTLGIIAIGIGRKRFPRRIAGMGATYRSVINFFI